MIPKTTYFKTILFFLFSILFISSLEAQSNCDVNCANDFSVIADSNSQYTVPDYFATNVVTISECNAGAVVTQTPSPGTVVGLGEFLVSMNVSSDGESDDCDFDVTVIQMQTGDCDFDCPDDQQSNVDDSGNYTIPDYVANGALEVTGNCGNFSSSQTPTAGTIVNEGSYTISLTADNGTSSISCSFNLTVGETLSNKEFSLRNFSIFPNPAFEKIIFSETVDTAKIVNFNGQILATVRSQKEIQVNTLSSGIYLLRVTKNNATTVKKLIIK